MDRETAERVWRRVRGEALPPGDRVERSSRDWKTVHDRDGGEIALQRSDERAAEERVRLRYEMEAAENMAAVYALLRERGCPRAEGMARQLGQELRQLRGEYYLCTGELAPTAERCALGRETIPLLREAMLEEEAAAEHFARTTESCRARQKEMYAAFRSQAEERLGRMRELLLRYLDAAESRRR